MATPLAFQIHQIIHAELNAAKQLLNLLKQESSTLEKRDLAGLATLVEQKSQLLVELEQGGLKRKKLLQSRQLSSTDLNWQQLLSSTGNAELGQLWQSLEALVAECRKENEINGKLLARSQRTLSNLASLMRGQTPSQNLYNRQGNQNNNRVQHTYAQA